MITQEKLEIISDEFQSTFSFINRNTISNMFDVSEQEAVEALIKKHVGKCTVKFTKTNQFEDSYDIWVISIT